MALRPPLLSSLSLLEVRVLALAQDLAQGTDSMETDLAATELAAQVSEAQALEDQDLAAAVTAVEDTTTVQADLVALTRATVLAVVSEALATGLVVLVGRLSLPFLSRVLEQAVRATGLVGLVSAQLAPVVVVSVEMDLAETELAVTAMAAELMALEDPALVAPAVREQVAMALGTEAASSRPSLSSRSTVVELALGKLMLMQQARTLRRRTRQQHMSCSRRPKLLQADETHPLSWLLPSRPRRCSDCTPKWQPCSESDQPSNIHFRRTRYHALTYSTACSP